MHPSLARGAINDYPVLLLLSSLAVTLLSSVILLHCYPVLELLPCSVFYPLQLLSCSVFCPAHLASFSIVILLSCYALQLLPCSVVIHSHSLLSTNSLLTFQLAIPDPFLNIPPLHHHQYTLCTPFSITTFSSQSFFCYLQLLPCSGVFLSSVVIIFCYFLIISCCFPLQLLSRSVVILFSHYLYHWLGLRNTTGKNDRKEATRTCKVKRTEELETKGHHTGNRLLHFFFLFLFV